jgi:hypothetical protein
MDRISTGINRQNPVSVAKEQSRRNSYDKLKEREDSSNVINELLSLTSYGVGKALGREDHELPDVKVFDNMLLEHEGGLYNTFDGLNLIVNDRIGGIVDLNNSFNKFVFGDTTDFGRGLSAAYKNRHDELLARTETRNRYIQRNMPELSAEQQGVRSGLLSALTVAELVPLAIASGGMAIPAGFGVQTLGQSYGDGLSKGLGNDEALLYASLHGLNDFATEVMPTKALVSFIGSGLKTGAGRKVASFAVKEMGTEQLATLNATLIDLSFNLDEEMKQAETISEQLSIMTERAYVTAIATVVGGGAQIAGAGLMSGAYEKFASDKTKQKIQAGKEQQAISDLVDLAKESKTKGRDKTVFKQFVNGVIGDKEAHIDAVQASLYIKSKTKEEISADPLLTEIKKQLDAEAGVTGEIIIPVADLTTDMIDSKEFEALRDSVTLSSETIGSINEDKVESTATLYMSKMLQQEAKKLDFVQQTKELTDYVSEQIQATARYDKKNAQILAQMVAANIGVMSNYEGVQGQTLIDAYTKMGLSMEGVVMDETTGQAIVLGGKAHTKAEIAKLDDRIEVLNVLNKCIKV